MATVGVAGIAVGVVGGVRKEPVDVCLNGVGERTILDARAVASVVVRGRHRGSLWPCKGDCSR